MWHSAHAFFRPASFSIGSPQRAHESRPVSTAHIRAINPRHAHLRVASVTDPSDYDRIAAELQQAQGRVSLKTRFELAQKAFAHTADYDTAIARYLKGRSLDEVKKCYRFEG